LSPEEIIAAEEFDNLNLEEDMGKLKSLGLVLVPLLGMASIALGFRASANKSSVSWENIKGSTRGDGGRGICSGRSSFLIGDVLTAGFTSFRESLSGSGCVTDSSFTLNRNAIVDNDIFSGSGLDVN
jgi:hypothetical protein